jgi:hypothetical protein
MSARLRFKRCVVIVNPASTNYARGERLIRQLADIFPRHKLEIIEVQLHDYERPSWLITRLNAAIEKDTLLAIAGGDGTNNLIVDTLLRSVAVSKAARSATILPLWAGNANDLAHMANGGPPSSIEKIIKEGTVQAIHPLAVTTTRHAKTTTRLAVCYASFGASAYVSARMNRPSYRRSRRVYRLPGGRLMSEMGSVMRALVGAPTFESSIDGAQQRIYDLVLINGSRIAKVSRTPVKLTDDTFYEILVTRKHPLFVPYVRQINHHISIERRTTQRSLTIGEPTWAQIDGEALQIPSDTEINVEHFKQTFNLLSTKLPTP